MQVIVVGGFLGSGKTTTIINMGKYLTEKGKKVAIIVNEIGEVGIDGAVIKRFGFDTKEITSGCICCSLKVGLRRSITLFAKEHNTDILMIEPTGIAFPHVIKNEIELMNLDEKVKIAPLVTLIDGSRFEHLMKEVRDFAMRQIIDAEILVINKVDLIEPIRLPILEVSVQQLNPKARVVLLSGKDTGKKFENFMQIVLPDIEKVPEKTPKVKAEENPELAVLQETESSIEASGVGSYSAEYFGVILSEMGHYEEAEKQYMLALEANPNNAAVHCYYGLLLLEMGRKEEAEKQYLLVLEADPNNAAVHNDYGVFLEEIGRYEEAEKQYQFALEANPKDADIHYNYGVLLEEMGRKEEAEKQYQLALEADPNNA